MHPALTVLLILATFAAWGFILFVILFRRYWVWDYSIGPDGITFLLFRTIPMWRIRRKSIRDVRILSLRSLSSPRAFFAVWPHFAAGNRWTREVLFLRTRGLWRRWVITPGDPHEAVRVLTDADRPGGRP